VVVLGLRSLFCLYKYVVETSDCITPGNLLTEYILMFEGRLCNLNSVAGHPGHSVDNIVSWFSKGVTICEYIGERTNQLSKDLCRN
jgi:S-adenosylhomocysteine hydrolase